MAKINQDFSIKRGTDETIGFDISPLGDTTGGELVWKVAHNVESNPVLTYKLSEGDIEIQASTAYIDISPEDSLGANLKRNNYHELEYIDSEGKVDIVSSGTMTVTPTLVGKE